MATVVEFRLPLAEFPLGAVIERDPSRRIELERVVPAAERILPFFWVWGGDAEQERERDRDLAAELRDNPAIRALEVVSKTEEGRLYQARWNEAIEGFVCAVSELGGTILLGRGTSEGWRFELRFADRAAVGRFQSYCNDHDVAVELGRVHTVREGESGDGYELTDAQRETIRRAYAQGYFEQPQGVTQTDLAAEFGVSQRAISRRLHRGLSRLVGTTLAPDIEPDPDLESSRTDATEPIDTDANRRD